MRPNNNHYYIHESTHQGITLIPQCHAKASQLIENVFTSKFSIKHYLNIFKKSLH